MEVCLTPYVSHPQSHKPLNLYISQPVLLMFCVILQQCVEKENELLHPYHPKSLYFPREFVLVTSAWTDHSIKTTQTSDILLASSAHNEFPFPRSHLLTERLGKKTPKQNKNTLGNIPFANDKNHLTFENKIEDNKLKQKLQENPSWFPQELFLARLPPPRSRYRGTEVLSFGAQIKGLGHVLLLPFKALLLYILHRKT